MEGGVMPLRLIDVVSSFKWKNVLPLILCCKRNIRVGRDRENGLLFPPLPPLFLPINRAFRLRLVEVSEVYGQRRDLSA